MPHKRETSAQPLMAEWIKKGTELTESHEDRQGSAITLDEGHRSWTLKVTEVSTSGATLGVWGMDSNLRDAMIYHGACEQGQQISVGMEYSKVHVAVNLVPDDPPKAQRWSILGAWYRQSLKPGRVEVELWVHK